LFAAVFDTKLGVTSKPWRLILSAGGEGVGLLQCQIFQIRSCLQFAGILFCIIQDSVLAQTTSNSFATFHTLEAEFSLLFG